MRDHLIAASQATGQPPDELLPVPIPPGCDALWQTFMELHRARSAGMGGPAAISWQDILAWQAINGVQLNPWEVSVIQQLDRVAVEQMAKTKSDNA